MSRGRGGLVSNKGGRELLDGHRPPSPLRCSNVRGLPTPIVTNAPPAKARLRFVFKARPLRDLFSGQFQHGARDLGNHQLRNRRSRTAYRGIRTPSAPSSILTATQTPRKRMSPRRDHCGGQAEKYPHGRRHAHDDKAPPSWSPCRSSPPKLIIAIFAPRAEVGKVAIEDKVYAAVQKAAG